MYAPCIILDSETDSSTLQSIVIATNLSYRKISKEDQIKAVLALDETLTKNKRYKNQINITNRVAKKAGISRTTANTIRGFKNLSAKALDLLYKRHITRSTARLLSMYKTYKDKEINRYFKVVLNEDHMNQYLRRGFVTQETLDKIRCEEFKELIKYA